MTAEFDASKYAAGMVAKVGADQKGINSSEQLGAALAAEDAAAGKTAKSIEPMSAALIPEYGNAARFETVLKNVNTALERGQISTARASALVEGLSRKYGQTANSLQLAQRGFVQLAPVVDAANSKLAQNAQLAARAAAANENVAMVSAKRSAFSGAGYGLARGLDPQTSQVPCLGAGLAHNVACRRHHH